MKIKKIAKRKKEGLKQTLLNKSVKRNYLSLQFPLLRFEGFLALLRNLRSSFIPNDLAFQPRNCRLQCRDILFGFLRPELVIGKLLGSFSCKYTQNLNKTLQNRCGLPYFVNRRSRNQKMDRSTSQWNCASVSCFSLLLALILND